MAENNDSNEVWEQWGKRLTQHVEDTKPHTWAQIAKHMDVTEGAVRHWRNGTRKNISLPDFFKLCKFVGADPHQILFGKPWLTDEMKRKIGEAVTSIIEADPVANRDYAPMIRNLREDMRKRKRGAKKPPP